MVSHYMGELVSWVDMVMVFSVRGRRIKHSFTFPARPEAALVVRPRLGAPTKFTSYAISEREISLRVAVLQPFVGHLTRPFIAADLIVNAELVANTIPERWHFDRCERVHVTCREVGPVRDRSQARSSLRARLL